METKELEALIKLQEISDGKIKMPEKMASMFKQRFGTIIELGEVGLNYDVFSKGFDFLFLTQNGYDGYDVYRIETSFIFEALEDVLKKDLENYNDLNIN